MRTTLEGRDEGRHQVRRTTSRRKRTTDALAAVKAVGKTEIITLTPEQKAAMKKALVTVHKENESRVGKETIAEVYKETGFKP
jgi:C4-dicarboxylate-binding protein DctP